MSKKTRITHCRNDLAKRAQADLFLGVMDQRPEVARVLSELGRVLTQEEDKIRERIRKIVDEMRRGTWRGASSVCLPAIPRSG